VRLKQTPSQTVGPFFAFGLTPAQYGYDFRSVAGLDIADAESPGEPVAITTGADRIAASADSAAAAPARCPGAASSSAQ
jgi:hypothetical protein